MSDEMCFMRHTHSRFCSFSATKKGDGGGGENYGIHQYQNVPKILDKLGGHIYFCDDLFEVCSKCVVISMCMAYYKKIQAI